MPTTPLIEEGHMIDPPVSVPIVSGTRFAETATPDAEDGDASWEVVVDEQMWAGLEARLEAKLEAKLEANKKELQANKKELQANKKELQANNEKLAKLEANNAKLEAKLDRMLQLLEQRDT